MSSYTVLLHTKSTLLTNHPASLQSQLPQLSSPTSTPYHPHLPFLADQLHSSTVPTATVAHYHVSFCYVVMLSPTLGQLPLSLSCAPKTSNLSRMPNLSTP